MKKKNSMRMRKALASFSVVCILFGQGSTVYASVSDGGVGEDEASVTQATNTAPEEAATTEAAPSPAEPPVADPTTEEQPMEAEGVSDSPDASEPVTPEATPAPIPAEPVETAPEPNEPNPSEPTPEVPEETAPEEPEITVDQSGLQAQVDALKAALANQAAYTSTSFNQAELSALVDEASALLANSAADQGMLDTCTTKIQQTLATLVLKGDTSALTKLVQQAGQVKASDYTEKSFAELQQWLKKAQAILKIANATAKELAPITAGLEKALASLVKAPVEKPETPKPTPPKTTPEQPKENPEKPAEESTERTAPTKPAESTSSQEAKEITSGDDTVNELDAGYQVDSLTNSNLNGYELPLLSSYEDERQAALVAQSLKTLGAAYGNLTKEVDDQGVPKNFTNLSLTSYLYQEVLGMDLGTTYDTQAKSGAKCDLEQVKIGDLLIWEENGRAIRVALYLGQGKYLMADPEAPTSQMIDGEEKEEKGGVAIYTLQGYQEAEDGTVTIEKQGDKRTSGSIQNPSYGVHSFTSGTLTEKGKELLKTYGASVDFRVNQNTQAFIDTIAEDARELGLKYDVYASVMIAQAILESGSGTSGLSRAPYYNLFGIKGSYNGNAVLMQTLEDDGQGSMFSINASFRNYPNAKASLEDYVALIRGGAAGLKSFYQPTWRSEAKNYLQATEYLTGRYATDTQYNNKLNSIIAAYHLTQYDEPLATDAGMIILDASQIPAEYRSKMRYPTYNGANYNFSGSYPVGQCTWYAYNRIHQLGGMVDDFMGNGGEWGQKGARMGYHTTQTPTAGYAVSFHPGVAGSSTQYGHVAFVEAVGSDGILVSEGNVVGPLVVSYRVIPNSIARSSNVTYIEPK